MSDSKTVEERTECCTDINKIDWSLKNTIQRRAMLQVLMQYRDKLNKDMKNDRVPHLDEFIQEVREAMTR